MARGNDLVVYKRYATLGQTVEVDVHVQGLDIPNEIKEENSPSDFVRGDRSARRRMSSSYLRTLSAPSGGTLEHMAMGSWTGSARSNTHA